MFARRIVTNLARVPTKTQALFLGNSLRTAMATQGMISQSMRAFSSFDTIEKATQKLGKALEGEIKYEQENYSQLEDIETFLNESGFRFNETETGLEMTLTKEVGDKTVEIVFDARQPLPDDQPEEEKEPEEYEGPSENYCDFTVFITEANGKRGLVVDATTMDTEISVNNVQCTDDIKKMRQMPRFERSLQVYNGPDFSTLDERIQSSLSEYLEGFGINEHLAAFVECMSLDKDQRLYMKWLSDVKGFIQ